MSEVRMPFKSEVMELVDKLRRNIGEGYDAVSRELRSVCEQAQAAEALWEDRWNSICERRDKLDQEESEMHEARRAASRELIVQLSTLALALGNAPVKKDDEKIVDAEKAEVITMPSRQYAGRAGEPYGG